MKSLKEFITENLENPTVQTIEENQEENENTSEKTAAENSEAGKIEDDK